MRISDWSSDVCSSDLIVIDDADAADGPWLALALERTNPSKSGQRVIVSMNQAGDFPLSRMDARHVIDILDANALRLRPQEIAEATQAMIPAKSRGRIRDIAGGWPVALDLLCAWLAPTAEIGRASGRERVCESCEISVVGVS